ncbi:MAG: glycosyltransferase, partial [Planctomycetes bacterium]|nr:glycosyltransferase [Planctomycetota bacterium]
MTTQSRVKALDDAKYEIGDVSLSNKILGYVTVAAIAIYLIWRIGFTLPFSYGYVTVALGLLLFICELISGVQAMANYLEQIRPLPLERPELPDSRYPDVDILIATHDEEINLIYNTLNACTYIEYPDKSKVHVYLCDDTNRPEMRALAEKLGVNYISMEKPQHAKAGNMNHALLLTHSPLVAFLDADMIPRREFLTTLVPYFFLPQFKKNEKGEWVERTPEEIDPDYKIGFVQSPQNFYNPDLFQFNLYAENRIPNEQIYFFREINVSRNRSNATHMCGSNMVISRAALAEAGYFATNNITEDHETGIKIQAAGYTTYAIPNCLANGLNPPAVVNLIIQRERWGRGCMQTMYNVRPLTDRRFSIVTRINYLCTLLYWLTFFCRFIYIMAPIVVTLFNVFILECSLGELLAIWLPYYLLHTIAMSRISSKTRTNNWSNTVDTIMFPFLVVPILMDMVGIRLTRFKVTDKSFQRNTSGNPILVLPHILLFAASVVGIVISLFNIIQYRAFYNVIILFWLLVNAKSLLLAIFFMLGRINERYYYRFYTSVPAELESNGIVHKCVTGDLSEGGLSLKFTFPAYIKQDSPITVRLYDRIYKAEMRCSLVQIEQGRDGIWTYGMKLEEIDDKNLSQYRQIIYERDPSLPETVNETIPIIEDIKV